ncbi:MAG: hypothetical protein ACKVS6_12570 [Planctomycetota bacterium]
MLYLCGPAAILTSIYALWTGDDRRLSIVAIVIAAAALLGPLLWSGSCAVSG